MDGGVDGRRAAALHSHLEGCARCRAELAFVRALQERAGTLRAPLPPPGLFEEILARRAAGERIILPTTAPPPPPARRGRWVAPVSLAAGLLITLTILLPGPQARAGSSELRFDPPAVVPGGQLQVVYRPGALLAGEERLILRGRIRRVGEPPSHGIIEANIVAELRRRRGGTYRGSVRLPRAAAFAAFAVEAPDASRVDSHGHRLWELLARDADGSPTFGALEQQYRAREERRLAAADEVARRMTELFPDRTRGWLYRLVSQARGASNAERDSLWAVHRRELSRLERRAASADRVTPDELAALESYARLLDEPDSQARWAKALAAAAPLHPRAAQDRVLRALTAHREDPAGLLAALEEEWVRTGPLSDFSATQGFLAALAVGDRDAALRWADRYLDVRPNEEGAIDAQLVSLPATRAEGIARLRLRLRRLLTHGEPRPLDRSGPEQRRYLAGEIRGTRTTIGAALLAEGRLGEAAETLAIAAQSGTRPGLFRTLGEARLALGDTAAALSALAFAAADPLAEDGTSDSLARRLGLTSASAMWRARVGAARRELERRLMKSPPLLPLRGDVEVRDAHGTPYRLRDLLGGRPALVVLWHRRLWSSVRDVPRLQIGARRLTRAGAVMLAVSLDPSVRDPGAFLSEEGITFPVFRDGDPGIASALNDWSVPRYLVLDGSGRLRFDGDEMDDAVRRVLALQDRRRLDS